jgi:hypothetical protein
MSGQRCDKHDRHFETNEHVMCPVCEREEAESDTPRTDNTQWGQLLEHSRSLERELARYKRLEAILRDRSDVNYEGDGPNAAMSILTEWEGPCL